jgi:hypothetical protein
VLRRRPPDSSGLVLGGSPLQPGFAGLLVLPVLAHTVDHLTGSEMRCLHECVVQTDPTGREMWPKR